MRLQSGSLLLTRIIFVLNSAEHRPLFSFIINARKHGISVTLYVVFAVIPAGQFANVLDNIFRKWYNVYIPEGR